MALPRGERKQGCMKLRSALLLGLIAIAAVLFLSTRFQNHGPQFQAQNRQGLRQPRSAQRAPRNDRRAARPADASPDRSPEPEQERKVAWEFAPPPGIHARSVRVTLTSTLPEAVE